MVYLPDYKTLFIHISKTGGTSITDWLQSNFKYHNVKKKHSLLEHLPKKIKYNYSFAVVRNPYYRLFSWYNYRLKKAYEEDIIPNNREFMYYCEKNNGFETFVFESDKSPSIMNSIWWQQVEFVDDTVDILKFENLEEEFKRVQQRLNNSNPLKQLNKSNYNNFINFSSDVKNFVRKYYEDDFKKYGYSNNI